MQHRQRMLRRRLHFLQRFLPARSISEEASHEGGLELKNRNGRYYGFNYEKERVVQTAQVSEPIEKAVSLSLPRNEVEAHVDFRADVLETRAGASGSREVNPAAWQG